MPHDDGHDHHHDQPHIGHDHAVDPTDTIASDGVLAFVDGPRGHDHADRRQLIRCGGGDRQQGSQHVARRWQDERTAQNLVDWMKPIAEAGHDPEVAAPTANSPEQVSILGVRRGHDLP